MVWRKNRFLEFDASVFLPGTATHPPFSPKQYNQELPNFAIVVVDVARDSLNVIVFKSVFDCGFTPVSSAFELRASQSYCIKTRSSPNPRAEGPQHDAMTQ